MHDFKMVLKVSFYRETSGKEPVREWLKDLKKEDRRTIYAGEMILLHGFIKKTQKTPVNDLELAQKRAKNLR